MTAVRKNAVVELLRAMPDEIDVDDLIDRLFLLAKIEASEAAAAAGDVLSHDEVVRLSDEWRK